MSNRGKANLGQEDDIENIFNDLLKDVENKINGIDLSVLNLSPEDMKSEGRYDLDKEFKNLENDKDAQKHPELINNLKQVKIMMDALKQFMDSK